MRGEERERVRERERGGERGERERCHVYTNLTTVKKMSKLT